jgi:hypothetical protein
MTHKTVNDYIPVVKSMNGAAFVQRYQHPFLFGREVLEEEFRFSTVVSEPNFDLMRALSATTDADDPLPQITDADAFPIRQWVIVVRKPKDAAGQDRIFLGRSETNDICVPHKTVSKLHAYFERDPVAAKWHLVDTGSANGTKHNAARIQPRAKVTLFDGDTVCFGRCVFQWMTARSLYDRRLAMGNVHTTAR